MPARAARSLAYSLRYASGIVLIAFLYVFDSKFVAEQINQHTVAVIPAALGFMLLGIVIYFFYRTFLYYGFMTLADYLGTHNYRNFIREEYFVPGGALSSTVLADKLFIQVGKKHSVTEREQYNFAAVHLLYQSGLMALIFAACSTWFWDPKKSASSLLLLLFAW
ncbi:MAG: hypothetical protein HYX37_17185 [Rhizobiales bacterium]|nr:hypothetical protein [Hyphomicrobiales bacterium]